MNKTSGRTFFVIPMCGLAACAGMSLIFAMLVIMPILREQDEAAHRRVALTAASAKAASLASQLAQSKNDLGAAKHAVAINPLLLQTADHLNNRLADITRFSTSCGLDIQVIAPGASVLDEGYERIPIHLTARGSFPVCMLFLHRLHEQFFDVAVTTFKLSDRPDDPSSPLSAEFELRWFAKPDGVASSE